VNYRLQWQEQGSLTYAYGFYFVLHLMSLVGRLCIRDIEKEIKLNVDFHGTGKGRFGDIRAGFEVNGLINRRDYGFTLSMLTEAGDLIVGEDIKLHMDV
jgi:polyisoprenoid-binding protein YceI